jgi:hypothetical protein
MSQSRRCDICHGGYTGYGRPVASTVSRYGVRRYVTLAPGEKPQNGGNPYQGRFESAGSIDLCDRCWETICRPRMKPQRQPRRSRNQYVSGAA